MILQVVPVLSQSSRHFAFVSSLKFFMVVPYVSVVFHGNLTCFRTWMAKKPETLKKSKLPSLKPKTYGESKDDSFRFHVVNFWGDKSKKQHDDLMVINI